MDHTTSYRGFVPDEATAPLNSAITRPVTVGTDIRHPAVIAARDISHVVNCLREGRFESQDLRALITTLRGLPNTAQASAMKKGLPWFSASLCKRRRANENVVLAWYALFDLDHVQDIEALKRKAVAKLPWVKYAFQSVRDGVKLLAEFQRPIRRESDFRRVWAWLAFQAERVLDHPADPAPDWARACFFSYDPDLLVNSNCRPADPAQAIRDSDNWSQIAGVTASTTGAAGVSPAMLSKRSDDPRNDGRLARHADGPNDSRKDGRLARQAEDLNDSRNDGRLARQAECQNGKEKAPAGLGHTRTCDVPVTRTCDAPVTRTCDVPVAGTCDAPGTTPPRQNDKSQLGVQSATPNSTLNPVPAALWTSSDIPAKPRQTVEVQPGQASSEQVRTGIAGLNSNSSLISHPPIRVNSCNSRTASSQDDLSRATQIVQKLAQRIIPYSDWYRIGMALYAGFGDAGKPIWDLFLNNPHYHDKQRDLDIKWNSFRRVREITLATLFEIGGKHGCN